jgi:RHS repeat-associated protein
MAATYKYDPYGRTLSSSGTLASANVCRFSSKEIQPNSGFYYYGFRFYDPNTQRWLNRDPIGEKGGGNLYVFVDNSPVNLLDATGRVPLLPVLIGVGVAGLACVTDMVICRLYLRDLLHEARETAERLTGEELVNPTSRANALTHCIASCNAARRPGPCLWAKRTNDILNDRERDGRWESEIDRRNNDEGYQLGRKKPADCTAACQQALTRGSLWTGDGNGRIYPFSSGQTQ